MRSLIVVFGLLLSFVWSFPSVAWTLEDLLTENVDVFTLVDEGTSIQGLKDDLSDSELKKLLRKIKKGRDKLKKFEVEEKILVKAKKRKKGNFAQTNIHFHGNSKAALNATADDLEKYAEVLNSLFALLIDGQINEQTYAEAVGVIEDLRFAHLNNQIICAELAKSSRSNTYGTCRHSLHAEGKEVPFELKANLMLTFLHQAYVLARNNNILPEYFTQGLGLGHGCLEARMQKLDKWRRKRALEIEKYEQVKDTVTGVEVLSLSAFDAVMQVLQHKHSQLAELVDEDDYETINQVATNLAMLHANQVGVDMQPLTRQLFKDGLKLLFIMETPPASPDRQVNQLEFDARLREANHRSFEDIRVVELANGQQVPCQFQRVEDDGHCGFQALGMTRGLFLNQLRLAFESDYLPPRLLAMILQEMRQTGADDLGDWLQALESPGYWMNDCLLEIAAFLLDVTVRVSLYDHEEQRFRVVQTVNPGRPNEMHIVNTNLNPIMLNGDDLGQNHFDRLIVQGGQAEQHNRRKSVGEAEDDFDFDIMDFPTDDEDDESMLFEEVEASDQAAMMMLLGSMALSETKRESL